MWSWPSFTDAKGESINVFQVVERTNQLARDYNKLDEELATVQGENKRLAAELAEATCRSASPASWPACTWSC